MFLETERLHIRHFTAADLPVFTELFGNAAFMAFSLEGVLDPIGAEEKLQSLIALHDTYGFSKWALVDRTSNRLIGYSGFGRFIFEGQPVPEFGYRLHPDSRGQGLATEAGQAVVADAFARLDMPQLQAFVAEDNAPSRNVLEKLGFVLQRHVTFQGLPLLYYEMQRADWQANRPQ